ncbi:acyl-CoA thioesterase [Virgibacillus oceani]|uniref:4-hydroxybenzoyl-CoA thioesterase n=1 Tax=Virgibacillus oceani TaxID=1479511 RepID=A0A917GZ28_9BACI|nr:thioesterase family protein [Virgibacillus oceani]GGG62256.1 4-hydroxybenzoyl-CoA thioesterase [Virgibacillus oceani]
MKSVAYIADMEKWQSEFSFFIPIRVRFSETDMFGHVNNVSSFIYFEEARIEFLKSAGLFGDANSKEGIPIVADLQCDYHKQMFFNETIKLFVKVNYIGKTSFDVHYMALNENEEICLTGRGRIVYIATSTGKPILLSEVMKEKLRIV